MYTNECCPAIYLNEFNGEEILTMDFFNVERDGKFLVEMLSFLSVEGAKCWGEDVFAICRDTPSVSIDNGFNVSCKIFCPSNADAINLFNTAKAYLNSMECNHDQLDRNEGIE
jgi:hypothetical protein